MMRACGWNMPHGPSALLAGCSLVAGCFFQPVLGQGPDGASESGSTDGVNATEVASATETPTTGTPMGTSGETSGGSGVCGDFIKDPGEQCDNGEANNGGGALCREDCTLNVCGDGYLATPVEGCDDGNVVDGDGCSAVCKSEGCGDGMTGDQEECDDGNNVDDDGCSNLCRLPSCGDGIVNGDEQCDDPNGNSDTGACVSGCKAAVCGDGLLWDGVEECDDGNVADLDGCSGKCELGGCGDGMIDVGEQCDDGNTDNSDGCVAGCKQAVCGDGFVQINEEDCDSDALTCEGCMRVGYFVFVTSVQMDGSEVGGLTQADAKCEMLAEGEAVEGKYMAWLSTQMTDAKERLAHSDVPYIRPDGVKVADDWDGLTSGNLKAPINMTETGVGLFGVFSPCNVGKDSMGVWTGTKRDGSSGQSCSGWSSGAMFQDGHGGLYGNTDMSWTECQFSCNTQARLYCVEQP